MKKTLILILSVTALIFLGCAKKKLDKKLEVTPPSAYNTNTKNSSTIINGGYENIDRYGGFVDGNRGHNYDREYSNSNYNRYYNRENRLENIYFGLDKYAITPDKLPIIIHNAKLLREAIKSGARVKIEGHCDMRGSDEYNYALGLKRAKSAKEALVSRGGIDSSKIIIISYGESSPECTRDYSEECLAKNRRVEFKIIE
jgi:peptidoglycan-associated lipoprotein